MLRFHWLVGKFVVAEFETVRRADFGRFEAIAYVYIRIAFETFRSYSEADYSEGVVVEVESVVVFFF